MTNQYLLITRRYPWPTIEGGLQYSAILTEALAQIASQQSAQLHVFCSVSLHPGHLPKDTDSIKGVYFHQYEEEPLRWQQALYTALPHSALRKKSDNGILQLRQLLQQRWSLVVVDHIGAAWSYPLLCQYRQQIDQLIYCTHNEEFNTRLSIAASEPIKAPLHLLDACRVWWTDARMFEMANAVSCISSNDIAAYRRHRFAQQTPLHLLSPIYTDTPCQQRTITPDTSRTICLVGSFVWSAKKRNLILFLQVCAALFAQHRIQIKVIGNMREKFRATLHQRWPQVCFTGPVDDVIAHLDDVRIAIIPEQAGGGFKLKSLEYIFQRLPIFALDHALVDLPLINHDSVALFPTIQQLSQGIVEKIDDCDTLNRMQQHAFEACTAFTNKQTCVKTLQKILLNKKITDH